MVEEPTPFVEIDDEDGVRPVAAGGNGTIDSVEKGLAVTDVAMRVVITGDALVFTQKPRVYE